LIFICSHVADGAVKVVWVHSWLFKLPSVFQVRKSCCLKIRTFLCEPCPVVTESEPYRRLPSGRLSAAVLIPYLTYIRSEEHTSELQSRENLVCRLLLEKKKNEDQQSARNGERET